MKHDKKAIVMGATSGIGMEVARLLAASGWTVGIAGRRAEKLEALSRESSNIVATACIDITKEDSDEEFLKLIAATGGMNLYFHSSGIGHQNTALNAEKEVATVATNAVGFTRMADAAFHYFESHPETDGHIAVISSVAGTKGLGAAPAYSATKRYVSHYLECLAQLCCIKNIKHIHLHDIRPGFVRTPLLADGHSYPMQMEADRVARLIVKGIQNGRSVIIIDWRYRLLVCLWRIIPRWLWVRLKVSSR